MRRGNVLRSAMYVLNIVLTGLFFSASALAFQWWVWDVCGEINTYPAEKISVPLCTLHVFSLFQGYNGNFAIFHIGILLWLGIVFITILSWWQGTSRGKMFMRVVITTWFSFLIYLALFAAIVALSGLSLRMPLSGLGLENRFANVLGWLYYLSGRGVLLFFLVLVGRKLYRMLARR